MFMPAHPLGHFWRAPARRFSWLVACCALVISGCANWYLPRIDPTGERLFVPGGPPPPIGALPAPPGIPQPGQWGISVSPNQVIAPVGSEVVMIATVTGPEGFPLTRERVEWMLSADGPGQFVSPGVRRPLEVLNWLRRLPRKVDNAYSVNTTLAYGMTLDRGTPTPADDLLIQSGQAWVSVTSATEGTSHLTVYAPDIEGWDRRQQSASIYWVDAQWRFPPPAITAAGGRSTLATIVSRQSDASPLPGWIVRYEIAGGPQAGFAPEGATAVDVVTGPSGEAPVEIFQREPLGGTNQINIQVIQPADATGQRRQLPVGSGATFQTWTSGVAAVPYSPAAPAIQPPAIQPAPPIAQPQPPVAQPQPPATPAQLEIGVSGPTTATVGSDVQFTIEVTNRGTTTATGVMITDRFDEGLERADASGAIEHDLVDLPPGGSSSLSVSFHVSRAGQLCQEISVSAGGQTRDTARNCLTASEPAPTQPEPQPLAPEPEAKPIEPQPGTTPAPATAQVTVTKEGPVGGRVGETVRFAIEVTNRGDKPLEDVQIADNFETTLEPTSATRGWQWLVGNALGWKVASLEPGRTVRYEVELKCLRETPQSCNRVTVTAAGIDPVADEACLEITGEGGAAAPAKAADLTLSVADTADPIKIDGQTTYQIVLANQGETSALEVEVSVKFSDELRLEGIGGPVRGAVSAGAVRFPPIRELRAGESPSFELRFRGARPGTARVQVEVKSQGQAAPVTADGTTEVLR
jgi:uncharacterized repeat protein (TIGR01451 family)